MNENSRQKIGALGKIVRIAVGLLFGAGLGLIFVTAMHLGRMESHLVICASVIGFVVLVYKYWQGFWVAILNLIFPDD